MIPAYRNNLKLSDENGKITPEFDQYLSQLNMALHAILQNTGVQIPGLTANEISLLDATKSSQRLVINKDTNEILIHLNGAFKTIQTS